MGWKNRPSQKSYIQRLRKLLLDLYGNKCALQLPGCYKTKKLEFAHLKPTKLKGMGRGSSHRLLDVLKHPGRYTLMCVNCHDMFDNW